MSQPAVAPLLASEAFNTLPELSRIEGDRICRACGYNLRQRPVRRDPRTKLLLAQCPECGGYDCVTETGGRAVLWVQWFQRAALFVWVGILLLGAWLAGLCFYAVGYELVPVRQTWAPSYTNYDYAWYAMEMPWWETVLMLLIPALCGAILSVLLVVIFPHWRRWAYAIPLILIIGAGGAFAAWDWAYRARDEYMWWQIQKWIVAIESLAFLAGLAGIAFGRPFARLLARCLIPPGARGPLAYLWLADGKTPPISKPKAMH